MLQDFWIAARDVPSGMPMHWRYDTEPEIIGEAYMKCVHDGIPAIGRWFMCDSTGRIMAGGVRREPRGILFSPLHSCTTADAKLRQEYLVYVDGVRLTYRDYCEHSVRVTRLLDGTFMSVEENIPNGWLRRCALPMNPVLVPVRTCMYFRALDDAVVFPQFNKKSRVGMMLLDAGAAVMRYMVYVDGPEHYYVWLPAGWKQEWVPPRSWHSKRQQLQRIVDARNKTRAAISWIFAEDRTIVRGDLILV